MPTKIPFSVVCCSGEEEGFPISDLEHPSPHTKGWCSQRHCEYPQVIGLKFDARVRIRKVQFYSHESKIATKIELFMGVSNRNPLKDTFDNAKFTRLGYLSLDSNTRTSYRARELKSVHVDAIGTYLQIVLHKCYINQLNLYNQVGLIAVNVIGDYVQGHGIPTPSHDVTTVTNHDNSHARLFGMTNKFSQVSKMDDISFALHFDPTTAEKLRELERFKHQAQMAEEYDKCKEIKQDINYLQEVGVELARLEARKLAAVEREAYDDAKLIKVEIDELRRTSGTMTHRSARKPGTLEQYRPVLRKQEFQMTSRDENPLDRPSSAGTLPFSDHLVERDVPGNRVVDMEQSQESGMDGLRPQEATPVRERTDVPSHQKKQSSPNIDERPIRVNTSNADPWADAYPPGEGPPALLVSASPIVSKAAKNSSMRDKSMEVAVGRGSSPPLPAVVGTGGETAFELQMKKMSTDGLPDPDPLPAKVAQEQSHLIDIFGEHLIRCLYSKKWNLREHAFNLFDSAIKQAPHAPNAIYRAATEVLKIGVCDKITQVYTRAIDSVLSSLEHFSLKGLKSNELATGLDPIVAVFVEKLGESNFRTSSTAGIALLDVARSPVAGPHIVAGALLRKMKNPKPPKPVLGRMELLTKLVPEFGIKDGALNCETVMKFVRTYGLSHASNKVRDAAVACTVECYRLVGDSILAFVNDLPKHLLDTIQTELNKVDGVSPPEKKKPKGVDSHHETVGNPEDDPTVKSLRAQLDSMKEALKENQTKDAKMIAEVDRPNESTQRKRGEGKEGRRRRRTPDPQDIRINIHVHDSGSVDLADRSPQEEHSWKKAHGEDSDSEPDPRYNSSHSTQSRIDGARERSRGGEMYSNTWNIDQTCVFCGLSDPSFNDKSLDDHYWQACVMLIPCPACSQIVEIASYTEHLLEECDLRSSFKLCPRCKECIHNDEYPSHVAVRSCNVAKDPDRWNRCPLCHMDIPPGDEGWSKHLIGEGCPENRNRTLNRGKRDVTEPSKKGGSKARRGGGRGRGRGR